MHQQPGRKSDPNRHELSERYRQQPADAYSGYYREQSQHVPAVQETQAAAGSSLPGNPVSRVAMTAAESFWYVLGCIAMGAMYFGKVPAKKALEEVGLATMTGAERFWYVLQCIAFGAGYFAKLPVKKALSESFVR
jgi:hypothetical protein